MTEQQSREIPAEDWAIIEKIGRAFEDIPLEELEREIDKAVAEVREEMAEERRRATQVSSPR